MTENTVLAENPPLQSTRFFTVLPDGARASYMTWATSQLQPNRVIRRVTESTAKHILGIIERLAKFNALHENPAVPWQTVLNPDAIGRYAKDALESGRSAKYVQTEVSFHSFESILPFYNFLRF